LASGAELGGMRIGGQPNLLILLRCELCARSLRGITAAGATECCGRLVYEAHDYGFDYSGLTGYAIT